MSVKLKYNYLPAVIKAIPNAETKAVRATGMRLVYALKPKVWRLHGYSQASVWMRKRGGKKVEVMIGRRGGWAFYVGFHEFGTRFMAPRPVVRPAAAAHHEVFIKVTSDKLREAARAR